MSQRAPYWVSQQLLSQYVSLQHSRCNVLQVQYLKLFNFFDNSFHRTFMLPSPAEKKHISWSLPDSRPLISQNMSKWLGMFTRHVLISKSCLPMASDILELQLLLFKLLPYICQGLSPSAHLESCSESDLTHLISDLSWPCTCKISRPSLAFVVFCGKTHLHARHLLLHVI